MDDYDDVQNWLSLSEVNTKESLSVGGRKTCGADIKNTKISGNETLKAPPAIFSHISPLSS